MSRFVFAPLTKDLYDKVIDFTYEEFFPREPVSIGNGYGASRDSDEINDLLSKFDKGVTLVALERDTNELAGVCINNIVHKSDTVDYSVLSEGAKTICKFFEVLEEGIDLFDEFQVDEGFELYFLGVHSNFGGLGIARTLVELSLKLARDEGFRFVRSNPTNPITMHLFKKAGFETLREARLRRFVKENGDLYFPYAGDTDSACLCVKVLQ